MGVWMDIGENEIRSWSQNVSEIGRLKHLVEFGGTICHGARRKHSWAGVNTG